ncbi:hypothetical protein TTHERM_00715690 (macronuclear) [Tetrahymena thermophila SB210]|uniref:Uncharacterized protein n=1 Tax=Tetrahymena thermophila (strain SB210) TaxID=312017 RepID=I7LT39_TETTS|nr:hypothetical protein TTHERM_00715690 [Tetrahymena thermophila SB210]EAR84265.1 hypothetical protein TTHERM_00715690 [Tetrahymena thermophila SB210]|eukprot:XP_001031928.1 hypothetical protein TTHERM_00715690 [Tetrahymena thermophila SB210]
MKPQNMSHSISFGMQQQLGSFMKDSSQSNKQCNQSSQFVVKQNQQNDSFQIDSQQLLTFQSRNQNQSDIHKASISKHQRNISQPIQQVNPPLTNEDSSFINQDASMEEQQFENNSLDKTNRSLEQINITNRNVGNISPLLKGENLFQDYMQELKNYKETFEQYSQSKNRVNSSQEDSFTEKSNQISQKQQAIDNQQQNFSSNIQKQTVIQQINRIPKILSVHSKDVVKTQIERPRTLTPPVRSPSQSKTAQKPNLSLLFQQNASPNKNKSFTYGENISCSPILGIAKVSSNQITSANILNNPTHVKAESPKVQKNILQANNSQANIINNQNLNKQDSLNNLSRVVCSINSSSVQKTSSKLKNVNGDQQQTDLDNSQSSSIYQTNKSNLNTSNNNFISNKPINVFNQGENCENNSNLISHSNNGKIINVTSSINSSFSKQQNDYNYQTKIHKNDPKIEQQKSSNLFSTPIKSNINQNQQGGCNYVYNSHSKSSPNQQYLYSTATTNTANQITTKQNNSYNSNNNNQEQNNRLDQYTKHSDCSIGQIEFYKQKIDDLAQQLKEKDQFINEFDNIKSEFFTLKKLLEQKDQDMNEQKNKFNYQMKMFQDLQIECSTLNNINNIQKKQIEDQQEIIVQLRKQINKNQNESISFNLENQNNSHLVEVNNLKQSILNKEEILQTLREKTNQSKVLIDELQEELNKSRQENNLLNNQIKISIQENNELQLMVDDLQAQVAAFQSEKKDQNQKQHINNNLEKVINQQKEDITQLKSQVDEKSKQLSHTLSEIQNLLKENSNLNERYNDATSQLIQKSQMLNQMESNHRREMDQLQQSIKNECTLEIMKEIQNITKPLIDENKLLNEEITREKQKVEMLMKERSQIHMSEMLVKINEHKDSAQKLQSVFDQKISSALDSDEVAKLFIEQLKHENRELRRNCDIWKAKYKKIQREMKEVNEQFDEYTKVMTAMKNLQSKMQDMTNSLYCSQSNPSSTHQSFVQNKEKINSNSILFSASNNNNNNNQSSGNNLMSNLITHVNSSNSNNNINNISNGSQQSSLTYKYQKNKEEQSNQKESHQFAQLRQENHKNQEQEAAHSMIDTLEGYDLFEQQLKEEIIQDINRMQNSFNQSQNRDEQLEYVTHNDKLSLKQVEIKLTSEGTKFDKQQKVNSTSHSPSLQKPTLTIQFEKSQKNNSQQVGKPPQSSNRDQIVLCNQKYLSGQQSNQNSIKKQEPVNYSNYVLKTGQKQSELQDYQENDNYYFQHNEKKQDQQELNEIENNKNKYYICDSEKNSPERSKYQQDSCLYSQEGNATSQQESIIAATNQNTPNNKNNHNYSNQANCSTSTQQLSIEKKNKRIKSLDNRELRLICHSDDEEYQQEQKQQEKQQPKYNQQTSIKKPQIQIYNNDNIFIEEEVDQDVDYSQSSEANQSNLNAERQNANKNLKSLQPPLPQQIKNMHQKANNGRNQRNADEFSFKNPSHTEHEENNDQLSSQQSLNAQQKQNFDQKLNQLNQQSGSDSESQNQRGDSNANKYSCISSLNNMACIESIQLDQDNAEILKQMRELDKKIQKEKSTYEKYLQKCSNFSSDTDNDKSAEIQQNQNYSQLKEVDDPNNKTTKELTAMLTAFDLQFEHLQQEKLRILNNFKSKDSQKTSPLQAQKNYSQDFEENISNNSTDFKIQYKDTQNLIRTPPPAPSASNQKSKYIFNTKQPSSLTNSEKSNDNQNEIDVLRKRYQQTVQSILGNDRGLGQKQKSQAESVSQVNPNQNSQNYNTNQTQVSSHRESQ